MLDQLRLLWRGGMPLGRAFLLAHLIVWIICVILFQLLSTVLSQGARTILGTPLGLLFVAYNVLAFTGVFRAARKRLGTPAVIAAFVSGLLALLSLWVPLYFYGRPLLVFTP